jgi:hypothetical protein
MFDGSLCACFEFLYMIYFSSCLTNLSIKGTLIHKATYFVRECASSPGPKLYFQATHHLGKAQI